MRPWNTLTDDEKKLFARMAEVFAGFSEYTDVQVGRIVDYLESTGQLDNTIIFYCADNGASGEGSPSGSVNENKFFNGYPDDLTENMKYLDAARWTRHVQPLSDGLGGSVSARRSRCSSATRNTLVAHATHSSSTGRRASRPKGEVRHQYHHSTDIVPTILDVVGLEMPRRYRGVEQYPLNGVSMRYTFDECGAPTHEARQYYAMLGTRGIWEDGWKAAAMHAPISGVGHFDQDRWELYHVDADRSESKDLSAEQPEKLEGPDRDLVRRSPQELCAATRRSIPQSS